jgi:ABC-type Mn2+/Zn2+ transport system ATPase subunit
MPGGVKKAGAFTLQYVTDKGSPVTICTLKPSTATLTTLRSPSGTGKSTLLDRFVRCLRDNTPHATEDLAFRVSVNSSRSPSLSIGTVPQHPPLVKHWHLERFLPAPSEIAGAAFGQEGWSRIKGRLVGRLSGGQQRRIYACSVLERLHRQPGDAAVLVLDETLDGLNPSGAGEFLTRVSDAWQALDERALSFLLVTHLPALDTKVPETVSASLELVEEQVDEIRIKVRVGEQEP